MIANIHKGCRKDEKVQLRSGITLLFLFYKYEKQYL